MSSQLIKDWQTQDHSEVFATKQQCDYRVQFDLNLCTWQLILLSTRHVTYITKVGYVSGP
jgi:hypothetical protein